MTTDALQDFIICRDYPNYTIAVRAIYHMALPEMLTALDLMEGRGNVNQADDIAVRIELLEQLEREELERRLSCY